MKKIMEILRDENGQGMVEYGLILGLIAIAAITVLIALGPKVEGIFKSASNAIDKVPAVSAPGA